MRSARLFCLDSLEQLWNALLATGEVTMEARARARLAASHAVSSAIQAVDLLYIGAGGSSMYVGCPLERAFRDVHAMTLHIGLENYPSPSNPLGVKGAGEGAVIPVGGLMANAVANALASLGAMPNQLPLSSARVWLMGSIKKPVGIP